MRGAFCFQSKPKLKIRSADRLAVIGLCAGCGLFDHVLDFLADMISKVAGRHHAKALEEILDLGSNNVGHGERGKGDEAAVILGAISGFANVYVN